ncbi:hypothetical protein AYR62_12940 [Secundilactobacillus paracollinoides]|uniref:SnoaL-like domain-containing protein n=1 Tax=Secundilactobacillus paracollinoides TaxID=240427 RepID=A0A1B2IWI6_9LACO|nr:nuclear transport factor 2 family protein [Secundilactobacillus paracollinoides]ANZ60600.1 hypothetical protein AYR61_04070 [Secundilactobacillus paracollinoides]ANZ64891.1 hypothetical protein AYR62_12940 [Secundilactobacillus paracollinoides]ANZ66407.1 hypothetical protein AYR63_04160 [Secundilactobacillus paracollinoides]KRL80960.1 hypothetical protein FC17_GL002774 [Secundilactobacillus paracollinoides DSM 15502 = JCM 11969]
MTQTIEARLQHLEDLEALRALQAHYADLVNTGWNGKQTDLDQFSDVFTADAYWKSAMMNVDMTGRDNIVNMLQSQMGTPDTINMHNFTSPQFKIDGDTATGEWLLWVLVKSDDNTNVVYQSEDVSYQRTEDGWKIAGLTLNLATIA